jgi:hypothetical protein
MNKPMFDPKDETYTHYATELDDRVVTVLAPIIKEFAARGHSLRDIQTVLHGVVVEITLEAILVKREALQGEGPDGFGRRP